MYSAGSILRVGSNREMLKTLSKLAISDSHKAVKTDNLLDIFNLGACK